MQNRYSLPVPLYQVYVNSNRQVEIFTSLDAALETQAEILKVYGKPSLVLEATQETEKGRVIWRYID